MPAQEATTDVLGAGAAAKLFDVSKDGVVLRAHVQPGARGEGLVGAHGDALKVRVRAAAVSGKANAAVLGLLARELDVPVSSVRLVAGAARRDKRVAFAGMTGPELGARLAQALLRAAAP